MTPPAIPLSELADLVVLHARAQGIDPRACRRVLAGIDSVAGDHRTAWPQAWTAVGDRHLAAGRHLAACRHYNLARFPFAGDEPRRSAARRCVTAFDAWRRSRGGIGRLTLELTGGRVTCWTAGLDRDRPRPLLLVMGGIVSIKEQWAPFLLAARRLGVSVVVTEMPGVGENTLRYGPEATEMIPELLDRLGTRVCAPGVHVVGLSFAGHLALAAARDDSRISSILTVGAPVAGVFADPAVWRTLPRTTTGTLAHLTRTGPEETRETLAPMALSPGHLAALRIPVRYVASRHDEIIPRREWEILAENVPDLEWVEFDDVHGSPAHLTDTRIWLLRQVMEQLGDRRARLLGAALAVRGRSTRGGSTRAGRPTGPLRPR
ncbi:alpha/beta fold hydrolase [Streptomyces sp. ACA25]|uniref:alpha/beta fold hydrolase n=1 Tax=Streptomyces sp. ACA25 TaxID=3022596 RepID=UPI002307E393|nr:alpha/beta fold hydrolase [Streptomyces sp. ACA25]MDB1089350.1 alpha/beta fold hydrolase [Streptomyces sp. ACA25]